MMRFLSTFFINLIALICLSTTTALAQNSDLDNRARDIGESLRCVVCQNQSIYESDAPLASDMRKLVKTRLEAGDSNGEVIDYMREKYGDYVLLKPPIQNNTYALWVLPFLLLLGGLIWFIKAGANGAPRDENGALKETEL